VAVLVAVAGAFAVWCGRARRGWLLAVMVAAAALLVPLLAKVVGTDYVYPRNMIGAWVALAVVIGAAACARLGVVAVAALCAALLALTIAVDTDTKLQRADWRGASAAIGKAREARAIVVPAVGDDPIAYYAHGTRLPRGETTVSELEVLSFAAAPRARGRAVPAGFRVVGRRTVAGFRLVRYRASTAHTLTRPALARARLGIGHAAVVVQTP
jgi:hypothetical protein